MSKPARAISLILMAASIGAVIIGGMFYFAVQDPSFERSQPVADKPVALKPTWSELEKRRFPDLTQNELNLARFVFPRKPKTRGEVRDPAAADFQKDHEAFLKLVCSNYDVRTQATSDTTLERALIDQWISLASSPGQYSEVAIVQMLSDAAAPANARESSDALVKSIFGSLLLRKGSVDDAKEVFAGLPESLKQQGYSSYLQTWVASMQIECEKTRRTAASSVTVAAFRPVAVEWLSAASKDEKNFRFAWGVIESGLRNMSVDQQSEFVVDVLSATDVHPWFVHLTTAMFLKAKSWETRGSGYADTVNKLQWQGFEELQQRASLHFQKAWLLRPEIPYASKEMIMISMAHGDEWSPRDWFDITTQAQRDYEPAFDAYLHTLKPRWGGSLGAMFEFADECAQGGDYETLVPSYALHVIKVAGEEIPDARDKVLEHPELKAMLKRCWATVDQALLDGKSISEGNLRVHMTWRAAIAMKQHDAKLLESAMKHLKTPVWERPYAVLFQSPQIAISQSFAAARCGEMIFELGKRFGKEFDGELTAAEIDDSRKQIDQAASAATPEEALFFSSMRMLLQQVEDFHGGKWVELRFTPDMSGWAVHGDVELQSETSIMVSNLISDSPYAAISPLAAFPPPYVVLAKVEGVRGAASMTTAGIQVGSLYEAPGKTRSAGRYFYANVNEDIAGSSGATWESDGAWEIGTLVRPVLFRVRVFEDSYDMQVNGIELPAKSRAPFFGSPRFLLGGSERHSDRGVVQISDVRVHRLELEKPGQESTDAELWKAYYESIVAFDSGDSNVLMNLAALYAEEKDWKKAETCVVRTFENGPTSNWNPDLVLQILMEAGNYTNAKTIAEAVLRLPETKLEHVEIMTWICATATEDTLRDPLRAKELSSQLLAQQPPTWKGLRAAAAASAENGDFPEAIRHMENAMDEAPDDQKSSVSEMLDVLKTGKPIRSH